MTSDVIDTARALGHPGSMTNVGEVLQVVQVEPLTTVGPEPVVEPALEGEPTPVVEPVATP